MKSDMNYLSRDSIRSIPGQLTLLGLTYIGAISLAVVALFLRDKFFERYVCERYPEPSARIRAMIDRAAKSSTDSEPLPPLGREELDAVYGALISDPAIDAEGHAASRLLWADPDEMVHRLRVTFVAGSLAQRMRALDFLAYAKPEVQHEAIALCRFLAERGRRRGEWALVDKAGAVLGRLQSTS